MDEHTDTPTPPDPTAPAGNGSPLARRRRRLVIPAVVAALALGSAGAGAGYAAAGRSASTTAGSATSATGAGTTSAPAWQPYTDPGETTEPTYPGDTDPSNGTTGQSTDTSSTATASQLTGLVRIATTLKYDSATAAGTGMVLTSDGEVVTNHHVVAGATSIKVKVMSTGATYTARVVGTDAQDDVAVLQLANAAGLDTVTPDTDGVTTGETVTAVGDGGGTEDHLSAASGEVLAQDQSITTQSEGTAEGERLTRLIQISSDVVSGYSGGATVDDDGEVVGMTTAASSGTSDIVGYAIPVARVLRIADALESGTTAARYTYGYPAFLGIALGTGTTVQGSYAGTPAAGAGIGQGDRITAIGGVEVTTALQLSSAIATHSPGDRVEVAWTDASGATHSKTVTLAKGPVK